MDPKTFERVCKIVGDALERPPEERAEFVEQACAGDHIVRREVEAMLREYEPTPPGFSPLSERGIERHREQLDLLVGPGTSLTHGETAAESGALTQRSPRLPDGTRIARYTISGVLGEGGMGLVYKAEQKRPKRNVALKLIRPGYATPRMLRRFEVEAEVLARLKHPGIAQIYDAGVAETAFGAQPYFAMELIEGVPVTDFAETKGLSTRDRLGLIASIADAIEHAHQRGVIHRDLKPGNILVGADARPRVLDFGVARATDSDLNTATMQTDVGMLIGTLAYMSPEQASGEPDAVDTRSDVYSLGMVAYELLSGRLPYSVEGTMIHEAVTIIRDASRSTLSSVDRSLRGDIETIVGMALDKDKDRRYQSAAELAADIRRYLANQPISARPPSTAYQIRVFARRNKPLVVGGGLFLLALVGGIIGTTAFAVRAERLRAESQRALDDLEIVSDYQAGQLSLIEPQQMGIRMAERLYAERERVLTHAGESPERIAAELEALQSALAGVSFTELAKHALAESIFDVAAADIESRFAERPMIESALLAGLAGSMVEMGLHAEAWDAMDRAVDIRSRLLGEDHPDTVSLYVPTTHMIGAYSQRELYERVYRILSQSLPPEDERVLIAQLSLSLAIAVQFDANCLALSEAAIETATRAHGPDAEITFQARFRHFGNRERLSLKSSIGEVEALLADALRVFGESHRITELERSEVLRYYFNAGEFGRALEVSDAQLDEKTRRLGVSHRVTLMARATRAVVLEELGRLDEAAAEIERIVELQGDSHTRVGLSSPANLQNLGFIRFRQGRFEEAEALFEQEFAESRERERLNNKRDTPHTMVWMKRNLAMVRVRMGQADPGRFAGKLDEGESLARETLAQAIEELPPGHWVIGHARGVVGVALTARGRYAEAEQALRQAHDEIKAGLNPEHEKARRIAGFLVELYEAWARSEPDAEASAAHRASAHAWRAVAAGGGE